MSDYVFHTPESAPEGAGPALAQSKARLGFVPNLYAGLANAPAALEGYLAVSAAFEHASLSPAERQVVLLTTSVRNGCTFCVAAHSMIAKKMAGVPQAVVQALRDDRDPPDVRLAALAAFTRAVVDQRGWVKDSPAWAQFLQAGYTPAQALEVVLGVTQKTLSNYANHLLDTPLNPAFEADRWSR